MLLRAGANLGGLELVSEKTAEEDVFYKILHLQSLRYRLEGLLSDGYLTHFCPLVCQHLVMAAYCGKQVPVAQLIWGPVSETLLRKMFSARSFFTIFQIRAQDCVLSCGTRSHSVPLNASTMRRLHAVIEKSRLRSSPDPRCVATCVVGPEGKN